MIPGTGGTSAGKAARSTFIHSVFVESSPDCADTGKKLTKVLDKVRTTDWDHTATKIIDILALSNIALWVYYSTSRNIPAERIAFHLSPQPFAISEVFACDQKKSTDRLYVDEKGFVANILLDVSRRHFW
jgi:hypothetical protein